MNIIKKNIRLRFFSLIFAMSLFLYSCASAANIRESIYYDYYSLAEEYYTLKKWDKALEFYSKSKESKSLFVSSEYKMGLIFIEQKKYKEAELSFTELLKKDADNATFLSYLAFTKGKQKKYKEAISLYEKVLLLYPMNLSAKKNLVLLYWQEGNTEKALSLQNELMQDNPHDLSLKDLIKTEVELGTELETE